jgi:hypothetical protein
MKTGRHPVALVTLERILTDKFVYNRKQQSFQAHRPAPHLWNPSFGSPRIACSRRLG